MATMITSECINCGACEPECPNNAISQGEEIYVIDPLLCTECVGFHDYEACAAVCPVDCCVTDPNNVESEAALIARAKELHHDVAFGENFESRFRKEAGEAAAKTAEQPAATPVALQKPPVKAPPSAQTSPPPKPQARPSAAEPPSRAPEPPKPAKRFPGELAESFNEVFSRFKNQGPLARTLPRLVVFILQPVLGALPHPIKLELERAVAKPIAFSAAGATALNILMNILSYPVVLMAIAVAGAGVDIIFSQSINSYLVAGVLLGFAEGAWRIREGIFHAKPADELVFRAAFYGVPLAFLLRPLLNRHAGIVRGLPVPVDEFYERGFVEKLERERRYGNVYTLQDWGSAYFLRMEFPTKVPDIGLPARSAIPDDMPDYDYDLALKDGHFVIKGRVADERIRMISSSVGAFPPEFTTVIPLQEKIEGFSHRFANKLLEILLLKQPGRAVQGSPYS